MEKLSPQDATYASRRLGMEKLLHRDGATAWHGETFASGYNVCFATAWHGETFASRRLGMEKLLPQDTTYASRRLGMEKLLPQRNFCTATARRLGMEKLLPQDTTYASRRLGMEKLLPQDTTYAPRRRVGLAWRNFYIATVWRNFRLKETFVTFQGVFPIPGGNGNGQAYCLRKRRYTTNTKSKRSPTVVGLNSTVQ
jgi:hypothetical protein